MSDLPAAAHQHERFMRLFLEHEPQILRAIMVLVPQAADARDVLQDTAVVLWQHFESYDPQRPFVNWALGFGRNQIRRYFRNASRQQKLSEKAAEALLVAAEPMEAHTEQRTAALTLCLQNLPSSSRSVLEAYYFHHRSINELAIQQGKSAEAVYKIIQRLRHALLDCITQRLAEPPAFV